MHPCLQILEVLKMIADELYDEAEVWENPAAEDATKRSPIPHNPLLAWTLTCRTFVEPGLDVLWRSLKSPYPIGFAFQPNVQPVFGTDDLYVETDDEDENGEGQGTNKDFLLGFSAVPSPTDWNRFTSRYARRVRAIEYWENPRLKYGISPRFMRELASYRPPGNLLPNLRESEWCDNCKQTFPFITLFLTPALTFIRVSFQSNRNATRFFDLMHVFAPALKIVIFECDSFTPTPVMRAAFARTLSSWKSLATFYILAKPEILPMSAENILTLSQCDKLQDLEVPLECDLPPTIGTFFTQAGYFSSLQDLVIRLTENHSLSLPFTSRMVKAIRSQNFRSFDLEIKSPCTPAEIQDLLCAITTHKRLQKLFLKASSPSMVNEGIDMSDELMEPLLQLPDLERFVIEEFPLRMTTELLGKMARSWSKISRLRCRRHSWWGTTPPASTLNITDLEILTELCPKLEELSIPFLSTLDGDTTLDPETADSSLTVQRDRDVALELEVDQCNVVNQISAARYLLRLYPRLEIIQHEGEWEETKELINELRGNMDIS